MLSVGVARLCEAQIIFELLCSTGAEIDSRALNGWMSLLVAIPAPICSGVMFVLNSCLEFLTSCLKLDVEDFV